MTRSSNNFGPYQYPEKMIPLFVTNAIEGKPLPLYGDGKNVRDWLYVVTTARRSTWCSARARTARSTISAAATRCENMVLTRQILRPARASRRP